jgi:hypothetical protein
MGMYTMYGDVCRGVDHKWMCVKMGLQWGCLPTILGFEWEHTVIECMGVQRHKTHNMGVDGFCLKMDGGD